MLPHPTFTPTSRTSTVAPTATGSSSKLKEVLKILQQTREAENQVIYEDQLQTLKGVPFWIWDHAHNNLLVPPGSQCCFNHCIGLPVKDNHVMPLMPYQKMLHEKLESHKQIWIKKSRGIGVSEFLLRWIAFNCFNNYPPNSRVFFTVGPRQNLAEDLIDRFKGLFDNIAPNLFDRTKSTEAVVNDVTITAMPSYHSEAMRGFTNVKCIVSDETDYYPSFQQKEVRAVMEGYIGKPNSELQIILTSTPKDPTGLMHQIEFEENSLYERIKLDYRDGLEGPYPIYTKAQIEKARMSPEFGREYEGLYSGILGNTFSAHSIAKALEYGATWDNSNDNLQYSRATMKCMGVDPGYNGFGVVVIELIDNAVRVIMAEEYSKTSDATMAQQIADIHNKIHLNNINVDGANPSFIETLKIHLGEESKWYRIHETMARCKKDNLELGNYMRVLPINFNEEGKWMLGHLRRLLDMDNPRILAINPQFDKLVVGLRSTVSQEYVMQKDTPFNHLVDAMRLAARYVVLNEGALKDKDNI